LDHIKPFGVWYGRSKKETSNFSFRS
jgi:hypothetical protein